MGIPVLEESLCGCCSLRTGSKIIAWLSLVLNAIVLASSIGLEIAIHNGNYDKKTIPDDQKGYVEAMLIFTIIIVLISFIVNLLLVIGVHKERPGFMLPWIIIQFIGQCLQVLSLFVNIIKVGFHVSSLSTIIGFVINIYFILVVYSYYRVLRGGGSGYNV